MAQMTPPDHGKLTADSTHPNFSGKDDRHFGAWTITTDRWCSKGGLIVLPINPESLEVSHRIRANEVAMKGGKYYAISRNPRTKSVFEFPVISFKFNSSNIQPVFSYSQIAEIQARDKVILKTGQVVAEPIKPSENNVGNHIYGRYSSIRASEKTPIPGLYNQHKEVPVGIQNLYAMINMVQDSWMITKAEPGFGGSLVPYTSLNRVIINTTSLAFPNLSFYGFIDDGGLQWEESAENFNNFDITFNLVVTRTNPRLDAPNLENLVKNYKDGMYGSKAYKGTWTDDPEAVQKPESPEYEPGAADMEASINEAAKAVMNDGSLNQAPKEDKELTLADRIRGYIAKTVPPVAGSVDAFAEKAKAKFDKNYAANKAKSDLVKNDALRSNPSTKGIIDTGSKPTSVDTVIKTSTLSSTQTT